MKKLALYCGVMFLIAAALSVLETHGIYLWTRLPATALRDGKPDPSLTLYQRDGKLMVQDGLYCYLIGHQPGTVGLGFFNDFSQFHANYLHCRTPMPLTIDMISSKVEVDPRLVVGKNRLEFTNTDHQRIEVQWTP